MERYLTSRSVVSLLLRLVVLPETGNELALVTSLGQAALDEQLLELGHLHNIVVGHGCGKVEGAVAFFRNLTKGCV